MYKREHIQIEGHGYLHTRTLETITNPLTDEECEKRTMRELPPHETESDVRNMDQMEMEKNDSRKNDETDDLDI